MYTYVYNILLYIYVYIYIHDKLHVLFFGWNSSLRWLTHAALDVLRLSLTMNGNPIQSNRIYRSLSVIILCIYTYICMADGIMCHYLINMFIHSNDN